MNKRKFFEIYKDYIDDSKMQFLMRNWYSIDGVKYDKGQVTIYKIKTRNAYKNKVPYKTKITRATVSIYSEAKKLGFDVKLVIVWLYRNWKFKVSVKDFNVDYFWVDKPKKYDNKQF